MMDETSQMGKEIRRITLALALVSCGISLMLFQRYQCRYFDWCTHRYHRFLDDHAHEQHH